MCPKRRMHTETRKRYIRGLAAGDGRPKPSFFYLYVYSIRGMLIHIVSRDVIQHIGKVPVRESRWYRSSLVDVTESDIGLDNPTLYSPRTLSL